MSPIPAGVDPWYNLYQGTVSAAWQIDLFGRVRRQSEAAQARVYASEQGRRGTLLTVVSGVASSYLTLRSLDRKLEISRSTAANQKESLRIFRQRFAGRPKAAIDYESVDGGTHERRSGKDTGRCSRKPSWNGKHPRKRHRRL